MKDRQKKKTQRGKSKKKKKKPQSGLITFLGTEF